MSKPISLPAASRPKKRLFVGLGLASAAVLVAELLYEKHPHVDYEKWFNFYAYFAALATASLCLISLALRAVLERGEDYYDD